jgi:transposase
MRDQYADVSDAVKFSLLRALTGADRALGLAWYYDPRLIDRKPPGQPSRLNDTHRSALAAIVESGPIPAIHGVVRWRIVDLCQWIFEEFRVPIAKQTLSRELRRMGYRKLSARPRHHAQAEGAIEEYKKTLPRAWKKSPAKRASIRPQ